MAETIPFYPPNYLERNWSPMEVPVDVVEAMAKARQRGLSTGVLSQKTADAMLPSAFVEGRFDYGLNEFNYPPSKERDERFKKMGIPVYNNKEEYDKVGGLGVYRKKSGYGLPEGSIDKFTAGDDLIPATSDLYIEDEAGVAHKKDFRTQDAAARLAASMWAEKQQRSGDRATEAWNPGEKGYSKKVEMMREALNRPENKKMLDAFNRFTKMYEEGGRDSMYESDATDLKTEPNQPSILDKIRRFMRAFTAY